MSGSGRKNTILCIGNDPVHLNLRCTFLKEQGWSVISSGSGHEGVNQFQREPTEVAVLDLNDDGSESALIAGELKRIDPSVRIVILETGGQALAKGVMECADAIIRKSDEQGLLQVLQGWQRAA
jgi:DNA-binding response OmpR family regulator